TKSARYSAGTTSVSSADSTRRSVYAGSSKFSASRRSPGTSSGRLRNNASRISWSAEGMLPHRASRAGVASKGRTHLRARDDARPERRARHASVVSATRRVGSCSAPARWQRHREHDGAEGGKPPTIRLPSTVEVAAIADLGERNLGERFEFVAAVRGEAHS